jgi:hypothetical protein
VTGDRLVVVVGLVALAAAGIVLGILYGVIIGG